MSFDDDINNGKDYDPDGCNCTCDDEAEIRRLVLQSELSHSCQKRALMAQGHILGMSNDRLPYGELNEIKLSQ